mmetsp:Transcript_50835/g.114283  ORF Transcript_50835/g.114283 Transcript_50835/m.114283 type:complete len:323 (+) Transcript_50835:781-1749(+)
MEVAHDIEEPREVQELVRLQHAIALKIENARETLALLKGDGVGVRLAEFHDHGEELVRGERAAAVIVQHDKPVVTLHDEVVAAQVVKDLPGQEWHHLGHSMPVLLHDVQELLNGAVARRYLVRLHVEPCEMSRLCLHEGNYQHEAHEVRILGPRDHAVPLNVEDVNEVQAVLLREGKVVHLRHADDQGEELLRLQDATPVHVKGPKLLRASHLEGVTAQLGDKLLGQVGYQVLDLAEARLDGLQEVLDLVPAEKQLLNIHVLVVLGKMEVGQYDGVPCEDRKLRLGDGALPVHVEDAPVLYALVKRQGEGVLLAEADNQGEE